jgi:hypothetical protein
LIAGIITPCFFVRPFALHTLKEALDLLVHTADGLPSPFWFIEPVTAMSAKRPESEARKKRVHLRARGAVAVDESYPARSRGSP